MKWWSGVVSQEIRRILAYRSDFWVTFIGQTLLQLFIARALWQNIFEAQGVTSLQGYNLESLTLYYILSPIGTRLLLGSGFGFVSRDIYEGSFTKYLLYPLSFVKFKSLEYLTNSFFYTSQLIIVTLLFHLVYLGGIHQVDTVSNLFTGSAIFLLASFAYLFLSMAVELIALWADNVWSLGVMLRFFTAFFGGGYIPLAFYPQWGQKILNLLPFPYLVSFPIKTIMGQTSSQEILSGIIILIIWLFSFRALVHLLWKVGQKNYTGVGQ